MRVAKEDAAGWGRESVVILNERAGAVVRSSVDEVSDDLRAGFEDAGVAAPEIVACPPDAIEERLAAERESGRRRVVVGGGDGTVATAAQVLRNSAVELGVLPLGTFNLLARDLGMPLEVGAAAAALATASPVEIDVAELDGRVFLCVCVLGFFPEVALRRDRYRGLPWWRKTIGMTHAMFRSFTDYPSLEVSFESDGDGIDGVTLRTRFVAVSNNEYEDGFGVVPRKATLTGSRLAAYVSRHRTLLQLVRGSAAFMTGSIGRDRRLVTEQCRALRINARRRRELRVMLDGEILDLEGPLAFRICPRSLVVLRPKPEADA